MSKVNLAKYRIEKAKENLKDAEDALKRDRLSLSVNRSYYAMFTAARALLALKGLDSSKHSGVIALFNQHIIKLASSQGNSASFYREQNDVGKMRIMGISLKSVKRMLRASSIMPKNL